MATLGSVTDQGCYKGDVRLSGAKFCHNCGNAGGTEVRWTFQVLGDTGQLIGTVVAGLKCGKDAGSEDQQKQKLLEIARGLLPD